MRQEFVYRHPKTIQWLNFATDTSGEPATVEALAVAVVDGGWSSHWVGFVGAEITGLDHEDVLEVRRNAGARDFGAAWRSSGSESTGRLPERC